MKSEYQHPILGKIILSSTRRATRISLTVRPTGEVRLSYPPYISPKKALAFLDTKIDWIKTAIRKYSEHKNIVTYTTQQIEELRAAAKAFLPQRTEELASKFNLHYNRVTIRATRSKWGSCTRQGNISLSLFLMTLPEHLRKPSTYALEDIMEKHGFSPSQMLVVDDMKPAYEMASKAGVPIAFAAWGRKDYPEIAEEMRSICDFSFDSTEGLEDFLFGEE